MTNTTVIRSIIAICFISASLFLAQGALAVTENQCILGGGHVSEGSGCKFCVGGKYDLSEITAKGKSNAPQPAEGRKTDKPAGKSGNGSDTKAPAGHTM
ncbi:MAG: hypothetical protein M0Z60_02620 [Nitrospiraceae bacterium]|nr:hypothetical protein [Nitrospiraceae bacterium]